MAVQLSVSFGPSLGWRPTLGLTTQAVGLLGRVMLRGQQWQKGTRLVLGLAGAGLVVDCSSQDATLPF